MPAATSAWHDQWVVGAQDAWSVPEVDLDAVRAAAEVLVGGGLVAFPTETVYGLGADARNPAAVRRVFEVKGRPTGHPLIVHLAHGGLVEEWAVGVPGWARALADTFWPGPLTLVVRRDSAVPDEVTGGRDTVGLRVPAHPWATALLEAAGTGIAAPSANRFGAVSATTASHVRAGLGDAVDFVLDGGHTTVGVESTIVDASGDSPVVLRQGGVTLDDLEEVLGAPVPVWSGEGPATAPGMLSSHYAPRAQVLLVDRPEDIPPMVMSLAPAGPIGVLAPEALGAKVVEGLDATGHPWVELEPVGDPEGFARRLYLRLHQADRLDLVALVVVRPGPEGLGAAVRDRLERAARGSATDEGPHQPR